ncbi:MAG: glycosyltransferase family 1 protein [Acidobacteriota bacterium]
MSADTPSWSEAELAARRRLARRGQLLRDLTPNHLRSEVRRLAAKWSRRLQRIDREVVSLEPEGPHRGDALFSYILDPFLLRRARPRASADEIEAAIPYSHTHFWESWTMARTFAALGRRVDCVSWTHGGFVPQRRYELVLDVRLNLERWAPRLGDETLKVLHLDTAHWSFHNPAQHARLTSLEQRRGVRLAGHKLLPETRAIETADVATVLGNRFTQGTYGFARTPLLHVPISVPRVYPDVEKDFDAVRRRFLWFGSGALVHKGLDRVLEAFAGMPDLHLTVCGPVRRERDFEREYFHELYRTPNIHTYGWIDVASPEFLELARGTLGLVYPSCSEGGGGSVYTCMHAGLVPVVQREVSVDFDPSAGVLLDDVTVDGLRRAVRALSERPAGELEAMANAARDGARRTRTKDAFRTGWRQVAERLLDGSWRDSPPPAPLAPDETTPPEADAA